MGRRMAVAVVALLLVGGIVTAAVVKTTTKNPTSFATSVSGSSIGVAVGMKGPLTSQGVWASTNAAGVSVVPGSLSKSTDASVKVAYNATGGTNYRLLSTVIVGFSFAYAKSFSFWFLSGGSMASTGTIDYAVTKSDDGVIQVATSGTSTAAAQTGVNSSQFKPLFKAYVTLVQFNSEASMESSVSTSAIMVATPASTGFVTSTASTFVVGLP